MDLVPCSHLPAGLVEHWDKILKKTGSHTSEWYGGYHDLSGILHKYIKPSDMTLIIGSGNSRLGEDLYNVGYRSLIIVDKNEAALKQMSDKNSKTRPEMRFLKMEVTQMVFEDGSVNAVLDRGTLDSLVADGKEEDCERASHFFAEVHRILKVGGRYVCITSAADSVTSLLLKYFTESGWMVRLHKVSLTDQGKGGAPTKRLVPVFAFICTKFKMIPGAKMPLEVCMTDSGSPQRVESVDRITAAIDECTQYAMVRQQLQTRTGTTSDGISVQWYSSAQPNSPRYTMHVVDNHGDQNYGASKRFAIFITPQGRETEWMFCSDKGRRKLAESAGFQRLLVVSLHRDHVYNNMDSIKAELSCKVMELAPPGMDENVQVPFLSIGDDIGQRVVRHRGSSQLTGDFVVEDVTGDGGEVFRRLVFLSGMSIVQSQARLKKEHPRKGRHKQREKGAGSKAIIDFSYLEFNFHKHMVAGLAAVPQFQQLLATEMRLLIIGLGAGILPMFLHRHFPKLWIDVVELDDAVAEVAKSCFDFTEDQRMKIYVADGLEYVRKLAEETTGPTYHAIVFDIDAKDLSTGLNSPPRPFIEKPFLRKVDAILYPQGVFMLNLISRDDDIKQGVIDDIKTVFPWVYTKRDEEEEEVNETLYAISRPSHWDSLRAGTGESLASEHESTAVTSLSSPSSTPTAASGSASELVGRLPKFGRQLQKLAQSASRGMWDSDTDLGEMLAKLEIR